MYPDRLPTPPDRAPAPAARPWLLGLLVSLAAAVLCAWPALQVAFSGPFVAADDARQHVFWMARFADPGLFPGDPIADYFQGVAPAGYTGVYWLLALVGVSPLLASKVLPLALALIATGFVYALTTRLMARPLAGVFAAVLLNHHLWRHDDLASGTPRAFVTPLFLGFLYFWVAGSWPGTLAMVMLLGLFYPQGALVALVTLALAALWMPQGSAPRRGLSLAGLGAGLLTMLPFAGASGRFGPTIEASLAASWPEFQPGGRSVFFDSDPWRYWVWGDRSGLAPYAPSSSPVLLVGFLLPFIRRLPGEAFVLAHVAIASVVLFAAAHMALFRLHLPSRYTMHTLWIVAVVAAAIALALLAERLWQSKARWPAVAALAVLVATVVAYPGAGRYLGQVGYRPGPTPGLYRFVASLPPTARIASISPEADDIPIFAERSVLAAREFAIPYQLGFYHPLRERLTATMAAQYTHDPQAIRTFVARYGVTHWLLDREAFTRGYVQAHPLLKQYLAPGLRAALLRDDQPPVLQGAPTGARLYEDDRVILLDAARAAGN